MYNYIHLHIGMLLLCFFGLFFITLVYLDPKKVYKWDNEEEIDYNFGTALKRHAVITVCIFIIVEIFYMIIKHLIVQR